MTLPDNAIVWPEPRREVANASNGLEVRALASITDVAREDWLRLMPADPESWDFYRAVEDIPPPGFRLGAMAVWLKGKVVAAAPMFRVAYRIDTPFQGVLRKLGDWVYARAPRLVSFPVVGLGSPMSDNCSLGFDPDLSLEDRAAAFRAMVDELSRAADAEKSALIAVKSLDAVAKELDPVLSGAGFNRVSSVPLVMLDTPFRSLDEFFASLNSKDRSYLRRRYKTVDQVRFEFRNSIVGLEDRIYELFQNTLKESKVDYGDFEQLHPDYFTRVVQALGEKAQLMLTWQGDELLSFQLVLIGRDRVLAKQIGMKYPEARDLNLYFVNWMKLLEYCIEHRVPSCEMGATTYATKLLFGGYLERRWLHFRFRSNLANKLLRPIAPLFDFERNDPELKSLKPEQKAQMRGV